MILLILLSPATKNETDATKPLGVVVGTNSNKRSAGSAEDDTVRNKKLKAEHAKVVSKLKLENNVTNAKLKRITNDKNKLVVTTKEKEKALQEEVKKRKLMESKLNVAIESRKQKNDTVKLLNNNVQNNTAGLEYAAKMVRESSEFQHRQTMDSMNLLSNKLLAAQVINKDVVTTLSHNLTRGQSQQEEHKKPRNNFSLPKCAQILTENLTLLTGKSANCPMPFEELMNCVLEGLKDEVLTTLCASYSGVEKANLIITKGLNISN